MSKAGVESNRGDAYQRAIAMQQVLNLLTSDNVDWVEVEATFRIRGGISIPVDDVVVQHVDGSMVCYQCKKNAPGMSQWTVAELRVDLDKAATLLLAEPKASVRFYSRADFRFLAQLANAAQLEPDESVFDAGLSHGQRKAYEELSDVWKSQLAFVGESAHNLLQRIQFTPTDEVDAIERDLRGKLSQIVNDANAAFDTLTSLLVSAASRIGDLTSSESSPYRLTKQRVIERLSRANCLISLRPTHEVISAKFRQLSAVGRYWQRAIDGTKLDREAVGQLLACVEGGAKTVLLTDGAGAGKTCVLLAFLEQLETDSTMASLFLQARAFSSAKDSQSREAMGLSEDIVRMVSTMAGIRRVVVIVDSLDVLSLARDSEGLGYFLSLMDRLEVVPNVTIVAACRDFDQRFNRRLSSRTWAKVVKVGLLDWEDQVRPMLARWGVDVANLDAPAVDLLRNPRNLSLYESLAKRHAFPRVANAQALTEKYLDVVVGSDARLGSDAMAALELAAAEMMSLRALALPKVKVRVSDEPLAILLSENLLIESEVGQIGFGHQTLLDALAVRGAIRRGATLLQFVRELPPVPFVRPAIRAFSISLRFSDPSSFERQMRAAFDSEIAWHIKRLLAETLAELSPSDDDWRLLLHLYREHIDLFRCVFAAATGIGWFQLWSSRAVPLWRQRGDADSLMSCLRKFSMWYPMAPQRVLDFWLEMVTSEVLKGRPLRKILAFDLARLSDVDWPSVGPLVERLLGLPAGNHEFLGRVLQRLVESEEGHDHLLWRFVVEKVATGDDAPYQIADRLRLKSEFATEEFLQERMKTSDELLDAAVASVEEWSARNPGNQGWLDEWNNDFLDYTSHAKTHSQNAFGTSDGGNALLEAMEVGVISRAGTRRTWWESNAVRLCLNRCGALRYLGLQALTKYPFDFALVRSVLSDARLYRHTDPYELGLLIHAASVNFPGLVPDIEGSVFRLFEDLEDKHSDWVLERRRKLLAQIPANLRSEDSLTSRSDWSERLFPATNEPEIHSFGGFVSSPVSHANLEGLSSSGVVSLLLLCKSLDRHRISDGGMVGGPQQVAQTLATAASLDPGRFLKLLDTAWGDVPSRFREGMFAGIAMYLRQAKGDVEAPAGWNPAETNDDALARGLLEELERHPLEWQSSGDGASALDGCTHVLYADDDASDRIVFCGASLACSRSRGGVHGADLITAGLNDVRGKVADAMMTLAAKRLDAGLELPVLLSPLLMRLALDEHPSTPAIILRRLAFVQFKSEVGWSILEAIVGRQEEELLHWAGECLGHSYRDNFGRVAPLLERLASSVDERARRVWARIAASAASDGLLEEEQLLSQLALRDDPFSWKGAVEVWAARAGSPEHSGNSLYLLQRALDSDVGAEQVRGQLHKLLVKADPPLAVPKEFLQKVIERAKDGVQLDFYGWVTWCDALAEVDPDMALDAAEVIVISKGQAADLDDGLASLLGGLFDEAESRELSDGGVMLRRVLRLQDWVFRHAPAALDAWLRAAERPLG